jgi:hypothetical protein
MAAVLMGAAHPCAQGQQMISAASPGELIPSDSGASTAFLIVPPTSIPRMDPELALKMYERRRSSQISELQALTDTTVIRAELPDTDQRGVYELKRYYAAPKTLSFSPRNFEGDGFVKTNVMVRLLQSEVEHVEKEHTPETAITERNYKFNYKGSDQLQSEPVHVYQVKPRQKRPGLFKGRIYLNALTGSLRRVEGALVKSPSIWIKKVDFVQDYTDVGAFTFPVHLHSECKTRVLGRAIVEIEHHDFVPQPAPSVQAATEAQPSTAFPSN